MNQILDTAFIAAKIASMNDEKARILVNGASVVYNAAMWARLESLAVEYSQLCNVIDFHARRRGFYTPEEYNLVHRCKRQIIECNEAISNYRVMTFVDGVTLLVDSFSRLDQRT